VSGSRSSDAVVAALSRILDRRERVGAPVRTVRIVGRNEDGTTRRLRLDAVCVTRGDSANHYGGQTTTEPAGSPYRRLGTTGIAEASQAASGATPWVDRLEPAILNPGQSLTVTVRGRGLVEGMSFEYLLPSTSPGRRPNVINSKVRVDGATFVSETEYSLAVVVDPGALPIVDGPLAWDLP
jgi:hypothetical protein